MKSLSESILAGRKQSIHNAKMNAYEEFLLIFMGSGLNPLYKPIWNKNAKLSDVYKVGVDRKGIYVDYYPPGGEATFSGILDLTNIKENFEKKIQLHNKLDKEHPIDFEFRLRNCYGHIFFDDCQQLVSLDGFYEQVDGLSLKGIFGGRSRVIDLHGIEIIGSNKKWKAFSVIPSSSVTIKGPIKYDGRIYRSTWNGARGYKVDFVNINNEIYSD